MKRESILPFFYFKNYYSFVFFGSLLFIALSIPFPHNIDEGILSLRTYVEIPMIYILSVLAVLNIFMYIKSFLDKTYRTVTISLFPIYFMISLKVLCYIFVFRYTNTEKNLTEGWFEIATCSYIMQVTFLFFIVGLFVLLSIKGILTHLSSPIDKYHWINDYLDLKQIYKSKIFEENGKVVSVYFKGFLLDERRNIVVIDKDTFKLNLFKDYLISSNRKIFELNNNDILVLKMLEI